MIIILHNCIVLINYFIINGRLWTKSKEVIVFEEKKKEVDDDVVCYCGLCYSVDMILSLFTRRLLTTTNSVE